MYKIIYNDRVIDVIEELQYLYYLKNGHVTCSDSVTGDCICGSQKGVYYGLQGHKFPEDFPKKIITFEKVEEEEFKYLKNRLLQGIEPAEKSLLMSVRLHKIQELKQECAHIIAAGISIQLEDKNTYQFELTVEDQLNLQVISNKINNQTHFLYHAKNERIKLFSRRDMKTIIMAANRHIEYNTTYFNLIKYCINNMDDISEINNIHYGDMPFDSSCLSILKSV